MSKSPSWNSVRAAQLARVMEELLRLDNTMPVVQALMLLYIAGRSGSIPPSGRDIALALDLSEARVSRNLALLETAGLIARRKDDAGFQRNRISPAGAVYLDGLLKMIGD